MIPAKKKAFTLLSLIAVILAAALLFQSFVLPGLVRGKILNVLAKKGFAGGRLKVASISYRGAVIENLDLGVAARFRIRQVRVRYSPRSLWKGEITALSVLGARVDLSYRNGAWDTGPFQTLLQNRSPDTLHGLPFDKVVAEECTLSLTVEGRMENLPLNGKFLKTGVSRATVELESGFRGAPLKARCDIETKTGVFAGTLEISGLDAASLKFAAPAVPALARFPSEGRLNLKAALSRSGSRFSGTGSMTAARLSLGGVPKMAETPLLFTNLSAGLSLDTSGAAVSTFTASLFDAPLNIRTSYSTRTRTGHCIFRLDSIGGPFLETMNRCFLPDRKMDTRGALTAEGSADFERDKGAFEINLTGHGFRTRTLLGASLFDIAPASVLTRTTFTLDSTGLVLQESQTSLNLDQVKSESLGLSATRIRLSLPFDWKQKKVTGGTLTAQSAVFHALSYTNLVASLQLDSDSLKTTAAALLGPWAPCTATVALSLNAGGVRGDIAVRIPTFSTRNDRWLPSLIPPLGPDELGGTLSADIRFKIGSGPVVQHYRFALGDMHYSKAHSDIGIRGVRCTLSLKSLVPFLTENEQHLSFSSAHSGKFKVDSGVLAFNVPDSNRIHVPSLTLQWARGTLSAMVVEADLSKKRLSFDLDAGNLDLQSILDFTGYKEVSGDGRIFGHVPLVLHFGKQPRLSFGNGFLEARPPRGGLRFSKAMAMRLLGIKREINPKTRDEQDKVMLMMLRALQDLEYTRLRMDFKKDADRIQRTRVETQGYGPRSQRENRVPVGGLNINISNLDDLLNQLLMPRLRTVK